MVVMVNVLEVVGVACRILSKGVNPACLIPSFYRCTGVLGCHVLFLVLWVLPETRVRAPALFGE